MTEQEIELFNDSLERCTSNPRFLERFYDLFIGSSPEIAEKFKSTNFTRQRRAMKASLYLLIYAVEGKAEGLAHLDRMKEIHGKKKLDVSSWMYEVWLECLLKAVKETDPYFTPDTEKAWLHALRQGVDYMKNPA